MARKRKHERGIALVAVIWIVASLSVLVLSFNASVRSHLDIATTELSIARSNAVVDAAVRLAVIKLLAKEPGDRWQSDARAYRVNVLSRRVEIRIQDHKGLVNLNRAPAELLEAALKMRDRSFDARKLVRQIVGDDQAPPTAGQRKKPRRTFADVTQLMDLPGFSQRMVSSMEPFMTVYGPGSGTSGGPRKPAPRKPEPSVREPPAVAPPRGAAPSNKSAAGQGKRLNALTAPEELLQALPRISSGVVKDVMRLRGEGMKNQTQIVAILKPWEALVTVAKPGPVYRIRIDVVDPDIVPASVIINVLLEGDKRPFHVLDRRAVRPKAR